MHSAGWLEGGLVAGYEKFIVDVELLQMMHAEFTPLEIDEDSMAFGAHQEVGHGGHFLGAMHTMERFRTCSTVRCSPRRRTTSAGCGTAARTPRSGQARSTGSGWRSTSPSALDAVRAELEEYVVRRRAELGD